jgi:pimeloyl-ACP methyl ester carboxylesterase
MSSPDELRIPSPTGRGVVKTSLTWQQRVGSQRDWVWRGWRTRYTYIRAKQNLEHNPPILMLHGFGASIGHWRHNLPALSDRHAVYALDMLGFGASEKARIDYKVSLWVDQVYDFWQTFIQTPMVLVGNSIGSLVCLAAAETYPEMVRGIVMISLPDMSARNDTIPQWCQPIVSGLESAIASPPVLQSLFYFVRRPQIVKKWASLAYANPTAISEELVEILSGPAQDRGAARAFAALLKAMIGADFSPSARKVLGDLNIPMLLLWGKQDRMIPYTLAARFRDINPQLRVVDVENAGHCPHDECPEVVNQLLLEWLEAGGSRALTSSEAGKMPAATQLK